MKDELNNKLEESSIKEEETKEQVEESLGVQKENEEE